MADDPPIFDPMRVGITAACVVCGWMWEGNSVDAAVFAIREHRETGCTALAADIT